MKRQATRIAIDQKREIKLPPNSNILDHIDLRDQPALRPGLRRDQWLAGEPLGMAGKLFEGLRQLDAGGRGKGGGMRWMKRLKSCAAMQSGCWASRWSRRRPGQRTGRSRKSMWSRISRSGGSFISRFWLIANSGRVALIASTEGGVNIEEVAVETPEKITTLAVDPASGLAPFHTRIIASALKLEGDQAKQCAKLVGALYRLFLEKDASLIEINPLVVTKDGKLICLDAKIGFDDNAVFRHPDIEALRDFDQEEPAEVEASRLGLSYVKLDGTIGCMVNGAGLAMATMDIIKLKAGGLRISWMSAAARRRRRSPKPSRSSSPIRT